MNFPAAGNYPYELDFAKGGDARVTLTMLADGAPIAAAALLTLTPARVPSTTAGAIATFNLSAVDAGGLVLSNLPVTFTVAGQNEQLRTTTTDGAGTAGVAYTGSPLRFGRDTIQAAARVGGLDAYSNVVTVQWNTGVNSGPLVSAGSNLAVEMPRLAVLTGAASDDGLPLAPGFLAVSWSMVSGPASVVFDNAAQASTAAAFTVPGTYVLRLTASDGLLSVFSDVTVTVTAPAGTWSSGWIASPVDLSQVTGQVPITLIPGITLTSGTLLLRSVSDPANPVLLSASTTGTGQIGLLDATMLRNGSYFIELAATNTAALTQNNLVLVKVQGDVKLGRVLATTTDLTVPAPGLAIKIQRTYDSLNRNRRGDFGFGWDLGVKVQLEVSPTNDVTLTMGGRRRTFYFTPQANAVFVSYYTPQWTGERGFYGKLESLGDNCTGVLQRVLNVYQCAINNAGNAYVTTGYKYTDPAGTVYTMGANGLLSSVRDLNGNTLTVTESGITSTSGLSVPFVRDGMGRITSITDALGRVYRYYYNAAGELITFEQPLTPVANTQYTYAASHYLNGEVDPRNNTATTTYHSDGRIASITAPGVGTTAFAYDPVLRRTTVTNPDGGVEKSDVNADGDVIRKEDGLARVTTLTYDANRNLATETNPAGETKTYAYDANGFRTSTRNQLNHTTTVTYNAVGGPTSVTDATNFTQTLTYDAISSNLTKIVDPLGTVADFTYNAQGLPATMKDARSNTHSFSYNANGDRISTTEPLPRTTSSAFNNLGEKTSDTNARGFVTNYIYDALSRMTRKTEPLSRVTNYEYDASGNKTAEVDTLNRRTTFLYDATDRLIKTTHPDNSFLEITYDFRNNKLTEKDELGRITKYEYDFAGQLRKATKAFGTAAASVTEYTYDSVGRKLTEKDPRGNVTTYAYDQAGRQVAMTNANGKTWTYSYDNRDRRNSMTDPRGRVTLYEYDGRGRQTKVTYSDTTFVTQTYDPMGLMLSRTDQTGKTSSWSYDAASRLSTMTDALGNVTNYTLDATDNKASQRDARNNVTTYQWDGLNRRTQRCLPAGMCETMTYDLVGNMLTRTDFNGRTTTYSYDARNRQLTVGAAPLAFPGEPGITRTYTSTGKVASMVDASGTTAWTYDNQDRILAKATPQGTLTYTYLPNSLVASVNSSNANGTSVNYAYDVINRLTGVTDNRLGNTTTNAYDDSNNVAMIAYPNGVIHTYTVDLKDQVTGVSIQRSAAMLASFNYARQATGAIGTVVESTGRNVAYGYDNAWRLMNETITADPTPSNNGALTYTLDQVANRTSLTSTLGALGNQSFSFDANDRITTDTSDANGNTLTNDGKSFTYDFLDRLEIATGGISFIYDGDGNRVARTTGGTTTRYLIDDLAPPGYTQVAEELVGGAVGRRYTYGLQRISQTQVGGTTSYYLYDQAKTTRGLASTDGATTDTFAFDAFGNLVSRTGSTSNEMLYRSEQFDVGLDSYYLRARYFSPRTGRFLTMDKYEGTSPQPKSLHGYVYGYAEPVKHSDPSGFAVVIGYGLTAHNYSTGAAIAGAHNAVMGTCLLSPAISITQVLATHGFASLASHPIVSACDPFTPTLPGGRMRPPGDCSPAQYTVLSTAVQALCHANGDFGQTPCVPRTDDKETCAGKATNIGACAAARIVREATCFRGGDFGHRRWIATMIGRLEGCWAAWEQAP